ncbi:MAG: hypothetical protein ABJ081_03865 [Hyphomicrobiales bacterium]
MERFVSNYTKKVDAKGRVSVPPSFRAVLQRLGDEQIYTQLSLETSSIIAGGQGLLGQLEARMNEMDPFSRDYDDWSAHFYAGSDYLKIDGDGRIVLTDAIRSHTGIVDEVTFAGRGTSFQLWAPQTFNDYMSDVRSRIRDMRAGGASK